MKDIEPDLIISSLSQEVVRDGKQVEIHIYGDGEGGWLLEVVDAHGNSTVWEDAFSTEQDALDEAFTTIEHDGIDSLIGTPTALPTSQGLNLSLDQDEIEELESLLANAGTGDTMDVATLEGYLTAIAIGPRMVPPSEWLPWVWDMNLGASSPDFQTEEQASRIMSLILRQYNAVLGDFATDPISFEPLFLRVPGKGASAWCVGFLLGGMLDDDAWMTLMLARPDWMIPFVQLSLDEGNVSAAKVQGWMQDVVPSLAAIHAHWNAGRRYGPPSRTDEFDALEPVGTLIRAEPKIGRNDPCPCGSGKKFKKCCMP
ncbi:MAG: UPF0149 family protein [Pseudomonadota bacterium]